VPERKRKVPRKVIKGPWDLVREGKKGWASPKERELWRQNFQRTPCKLPKSFKEEVKVKKGEWDRLGGDICNTNNVWENIR